MRVWELVRLLAQQADTPTLNWSLLGAGALIAVPAWATTWLFWRMIQDRDKQLATKDTEIGGLLRDSATRERELANTTIPVLTQAVQLLSTAPDRFDRALNEAQRSVQSDALDRKMRQLEEWVDEIRKPVK